MSSMRRLIGMLRDGWLIVGITLCLLAALEALYRLQAYARGVGRAPDELAVEVRPAWWAEYSRERKASLEALQWHPYVYYRQKEFKGRYINVDRSGIRRTVQASASHADPAVFMFGGSTMYGAFQRDEWTLPSVLAQRFEHCTGGGLRFVNFGQTGWVFTQEVIELMLQLRDGAVPKVVVFYDGINDVAAAIQNGRPGWPQNEANRSRDFAFGRMAFWWEHNTVSDLRALGAVALAGLTRAQVLQRVRPFEIPGLLPAVPASAGTVARSVASSYVDTLRLAQALSDQYGFEAIYVWQPTLHATQKRLTPGETTLMNQLRADPFGAQLIRLHREMPERLASTVSRRDRDAFVNLSGAFDRETRPVFSDGIGHTYEHANITLADALTPYVARALRVSGVTVTCPDVPHAFGERTEN